MENTEPKQKSLLELYQLLWEQIKDETLLAYGLCYVVRTYLEISRSEIYVLRKSIEFNMPDKESTYGWPRTEQGTADRKAFVQRMIKELQDEGTD